MRSLPIVALAPTFHDHPRLVQHIEEFAVEQFVPRFSVEGFNMSILPWTPRLDKQRRDGEPLVPLSKHPGNKLWAVALRICVGQLRSRNNSLKTSWTSYEVSRRWAAIARHSRVYSSTIVSSFSGRPSWVRSIAKSYDQTWFEYSARRRRQEPSANQSRAR